MYLAASQTALHEAERWMAAQLAALAPVTDRALPSAVQAAILTDAIAEWTGGQRRLAMASRRAPSAGWLAAETRFWRGLAQAIGFGAQADTIACFASGEAARHLLVWNSAVDRALLEETTAALLAWLTDRRFHSEAVRAAHRELARQAYSEPAARADGEFAVLAQAAADLLARRGHAGVTFRAVATEAGVTLGTVIHRVGSKSELLRCALHRLYEREALRDSRDQFVAQALPPEDVLAHLLDAVLSGRQPVLRAYDEIELAIYNGPEFTALRGVVRSMDDPSGTWALRQLTQRSDPPASLVAAFSAVIRGIGARATIADQGRAAVEKLARAALAPFVSDG